MNERQGMYRILFVDDAPLNVRILLEMLREEYDVISTDNGFDALEMAAAEPQPDLILLDIMMPGMNGYEVLERLKSNEQTSHIPVMFITALSDDDEEKKGLEIGAVDYIRKPFNMSIVKARIKTQLELKHHRDELRKRTNDLISLNEQLEREIEQRRKTEAMIQEHLLYMQQIIKENSFPTSVMKHEPETTTD